jgi:hypothetical protein
MKRSHSNDSGKYKGVITEIGRNVWTQGERIGPLAAREPVYRVDVPSSARTWPRSGRNSSSGPECS